MSKRDEENRRSWAANIAATIVIAMIKRSNVNVSANEAKKRTVVIANTIDKFIKGDNIDTIVGEEDC